MQRRLGSSHFIALEGAVAIPHENQVTLAVTVRASFLCNVKQSKREPLRLEPPLERFSVYGFSIGYLKGSRLEFNPKSRDVEGDVVFHSPEKVKIFLSWGDLAKASGFDSVESHVDHSLNKIKAASNVRNFEQVSRNMIEVRSHQAVYNKARFDEVTVGFLTGRTKTPREGHSVHVHCPESGRYFVVYGILPNEAGYDYESVFVDMAKSLNCH